MNSRPRRIARKMAWVFVALWLIAYIGSFFTANAVIDYVHIGLIPVWAILLWYGWDDSNITIADLREPEIIDVVPTDVKKERKLLP